jgi:methyltransferase (TIGR00027 family)
MIRAVDASSAVSRTAIMTAVACALHREEPQPHVLDDSLALPLAGEGGAAIRRQLESTLSPESLQAFSRWCCVRSRFPENVVERELTLHGIDQYVVLGAGLDTFAERRTDLLNRLRVFEVDHPATQQWKRARLEELGVTCPANLVFAPVDFERETLGDALRSAAFNFQSPAVFAWIGVTMFLTLDAIVSTLDLVARCADRTQIVLTYNLPPEVLGELGAQTDAAISQIAAGMDEPMISRFTPNDIEVLMADRGFTELVHLGPDEARALYFENRPDVRFGGAQRIIAGTVRR